MASLLSKCVDQITQLAVIIKFVEGASIPLSMSLIKMLKKGIEMLDWIQRAMKMVWDLEHLRELGLFKRRRTT